MTQLVKLALLLCPLFFVVMRFRLSLNRTTKQRMLPMDYQYYISAWIYKVLKQADENFALFLHEKGYGKNDPKLYKLFCFSPLNFGKPILWKEKKSVFKQNKISYRFTFLPRIPKGKNSKLFFSTNPEMSGKDVIEYYRNRFQIEFRFRDVKGFTGLMQSQARDVAKLSFNFNASLTSLNLTNVLSKGRGIPFSVASCKTLIHNDCLFERFICVSGIKPDRRLNEKLVKELLEFVAIAA